MGRLGSFVLGIVVGGAGVYTSLEYHVVRSDEQFELVPKLSANFSETYVDVRGWTLSDWNSHKMLAAAVVKAKKEHLLKNSAADSLLDGMKNILNELDDKPGTS